jgi:cyclophilin family peptidyl-prolyl cis-trans isomerase
MSMLNRILILLIVVAAVIGGVFYFRNHKSNSTNQTTDNNTQMSETPTPPPAAVPDKVVARFETNMGNFDITLDGKAAPKTVANFVKLANDGFYNGLTFHRVTKQEGFHLIQGGDPNGDGSGGPGFTIPAEIGLKHTKGAIAMARLGDQVNPTKASSGSQFYITEEDIPQLDGNYTVFGYVSSGMETVMKIGAVQTGPDDKPLQKVVINRISIK